MRTLHAIAIATTLLAPLALGGCAAQMGTVAGNVVGGTAWVVTKTGAVAWNGTKFAAQTTGRAVVGATRGVHDEFSQNGAQVKPVVTDSADLANRVKEPSPVGTLSQGQSAGLAY